MSLYLLYQLIHLEKNSTHCVGMLLVELEAIITVQVDSRTCRNKPKDPWGLVTHSKETSDFRHEMGRITPFLFCGHTVYSSRFYMIVCC